MQSTKTISKCVPALVAFLSLLFASNAQEDVRRFHLDVDDCDDIAIQPKGDIYLACHSTHAPGEASAGSPNMDAFVVKVGRGTGEILHITRFGGSSVDAAIQIIVDPSGNAYVTGLTKSRDFPVTRNALQMQYGGGDLDAFLVKVGPHGDVLYSTFIGGDGIDEGHGLTLNTTGLVYVAGTTTSKQFPGSDSAFRFGQGGAADAFISSVNVETGKTYRTAIIGGSGEEKLTGIVSGKDSLFLTGYTRSRNFPVRRALQQGLHGVSDAFVLKIGRDLESVASSTYFGGSGDDSAWGIDLAPDGGVIVAGTSDSRDLPRNGILNHGELAGGVDAFLIKLNPSAEKLTFSTYYGGSGTDNSGFDGGSVSVAPDGVIWLAGMTNSEDLPVPGADQPTYGGGELNGFVAAFSPTGRLCYGTYAGGTARHFLEGITVTGDGVAYATGSAIRPVMKTARDPRQGERLGNIVLKQPQTTSDCRPE